MDGLGLACEQFTDREREAVVDAYPRGKDFRNGIIRSFHEGMKHPPDTTFGTCDDDVLALYDPSFRRVDFCTIIQQSSWPS